MEYPPIDTELWDRLAAEASYLHNTYDLPQERAWEIVILDQIGRGLADLNDILSVALGVEDVE